jgi:hypothetical protein
VLWKDAAEVWAMNMSELRARWDKLMGWRPQLDRPYKLLAVFVTTIVTVAVIERLANAEDMQWIRDWVRSSKIYGALFFPERVSIEWKDRLQGLVLLLGLPVAFCLWHWRDKNVREQIENARKDTNLKEFQTVQMHAAGAFGDDVPPEAREQLQIAALHQLGAFVRCDFGKSFVVPAIELLFSGHQAALERVGTPEEWNNVFSFRTFDDEDWAQKIDAPRVKFQAALTHVDYARMDIIRREWNAIRKSNISLENRKFDLLELREADFRKARCLGSTFFGTNLQLSDFSDADLRYTKMQGAYLWEADFTGAKAGGQLFGATLNGMIFDDFTKLDFAWDAFDEARRNQCRESFKDRGARHESDPPFDGPNYVRGKKGLK